MHVIAVVSQKGGSGKTTLTGHLSVQAERSGHGPVAVIDTDPQGSLAAWWNEREDPAPVFVQTTLHELREHLANMRQAGVRTVVIDTPPAITGAIHEVIRIADYVVVPTKPSPHDLRAVGATVKLVESCAKPMVFVLNDASPRAKITFEAAIALSQHGTVAPVTIHHRTLFASSMIDGRTAMELEPNGQSATEILGLWEYINARLNAQVVPTAIGLDALNRRDGLSSGKQPFALSTAQGEFSDEDEEAPELIVETPDPQQVPLTAVKPLERVPDPVPRAFATPPGAPGTGPNLWDGFAPSPEDGKDLRPQTTQPQRTSNGHEPRVFGRRQVRQVI
ncbi:ParA family protein [Magnetovibrio sp.]|uniref:ParA family protein n=1 Tax=Magnetovibrio sp. TaxID=2024836 RepID=UPI002F950956